MPNKKNVNRIGVQFNTVNEIEKNALEILNGMGRKKAAYIAIAIDAYEKNHKATIEEIRVIVKEIIAENLKNLKPTEKNEKMAAIVASDEKEKEENKSTILSAPSDNCRVEKSQEVSEDVRTVGNSNQSVVVTKEQVEVSDEDMTSFINQTLSSLGI